MENLFPAGKHFSYTTKAAMNCIKDQEHHRNRINGRIGDAGSELSVIESAAASPGVLVILLQSFRSDPEMYLKTKCPKDSHDHRD